MDIPPEGAPRFSPRVIHPMTLSHHKKSPVGSLSRFLVRHGMKILSLFLVIVAFVKAFVIHGHLQRIAGEGDFFFWYSIRHDSILFAILLLVWFIHDAFLKNRAARVIVRLVFLSIVFFYLLDIVILLNFNTHLFLNDLFKYMAGAPGVVANLFWNFSSGWALVGFVLFLAFLGGFLYLFLRYDHHTTGFFRKILLVFMFLCFGISLLPHDREYVHSWVYENFLEYNVSIWSQNIGYSEGFKKTFKPLKAVYREDCVQGTANRKNIVLVVFESLSKYHSKRFSGLNDWVPRFDEIAGNHVMFTHFYANGFSTEEGLISLLTGKVPLCPPDLLYNGGIVTFDGFFGFETSLPAFLKGRGYATEFLTSGNLGFSKKGKWLHSMGFAYVEGHAHPFYDGYPRFHFDAAPDEALYARAMDRIFDEKRKKPLFLVIETVSTHHPFIDPVSGTFSEQEAFRYADDQLGKFYDGLKKKGFFRDGILLITSDHRSMTPLTRNEMNLYGFERAVAEVPFVLVDARAGKKVVEEPFQLTDVCNSLFNYVCEEKCTNLWKGDFLKKDPVPPEYIIHKNGFQRNHVFVFRKDGHYTVKLDGDHTRVLSENDPEDKLSGLLVNKINYERISLTEGKEERAKGPSSQ